MPVYAHEQKTPYIGKKIHEHMRTQTSEKEKNHDASRIRSLWLLQANKENVSDQSTRHNNFLSGLFGRSIFLLSAENGESGLYSWDGKQGIMFERSEREKAQIGFKG